MCLFVCVWVKGKVFEQRYCTAIVTELKMRFSLRLNFALLNSAFGRWWSWNNNDKSIHLYSQSRSARSHNISDIFLKAFIRVSFILENCQQTPKEIPSLPSLILVCPFCLVSSWFERRATVPPSLCNLLHMHNRQVLRIGDKKLKCLQGIARV